MSVYVNFLKDQVSFLQNEVERHAQFIDQMLVENAKIAQEKNELAKANLALVAIMEGRDPDEAGIENGSVVTITPSEPSFPAPPESVTEEIPIDETTQAPTDMEVTQPEFEGGRRKRPTKDTQGKS